MYTYFIGKISELNPTQVVVDCQGVGYELNISLYTFEQLKEKDQAKVFAHLSIKEDAHTLYGFSGESERHLFRQLISVQGIGASTARMMLSSINPNDLMRAIASGNIALIRSVKGVGPKSAQRIILELQEKMQKLDIAGGLSTVASGSTPNKEEALAALVMLGFAKNTIEKVLGQIATPAEIDTLAVEEIIKRALKKL